jgi:hypothetical protein
MIRGFKILYFVNLAIILFALSTPIIEHAFATWEYPWLIMKYYIVGIVLSVTFCVSFLCLNVYGVVKFQQHRVRYLLVVILMSVWIISGVYQWVYLFVHDVPL